MAWTLEDCDKPLRIGKKREHYGSVMKENLQVKEQRRKKAEEQLETQGAELEGAHAELKAAQAKLAQLKVTSSKHRENALMEVSRLQARVEDAERKLVGVPEEITIAKITVLAQYQSSTEFEKVRTENFDEGVPTFIYNVWREHPEQDLSFLGEAVREMVTEFNAPPETPIANLPVEFMPPANQCPQVTDRPPQVINEDSPVVIAGGGGGADEDDEVMQIDNLASVLSYD